MHAYGPWLLVSYGRQGNRGPKSRNNNGSGHAAIGKQAGSGNSSGYAVYYNGMFDGYAGHSISNAGGYVGHSIGNAGHSNRKHAANGKLAGIGVSNGKKNLAVILRVTVGVKQLK